MLIALQTPPNKYTPASLRGGGCCWAYEPNQDITLLMWRMRVTSTATLKHYLQEVVATNSLASLHSDVRHTIQVAADSFAFLQLRLKSKTYAAGTSTSLDVAASADSPDARASLSRPPTRP